MGWGGMGYACSSQALRGSSEEGPGAPWGVCGADRLRSGQGPGAGVAQKGLISSGPVCRSCAQSAAPAGAVSLRLGTAVNLHLYWRLLFPGPGGRRVATAVS